MRATEQVGVGARTCGRSGRLSQLLPPWARRRRVGGVPSLHGLHGHRGVRGLGHVWRRRVGHGLCRWPLCLCPTSCRAHGEVRGPCPLSVAAGWICRAQAIGRLPCARTMHRQQGPSQLAWHPLDLARSGLETDRRSDLLPYVCIPCADSVVIAGWTMATGSGRAQSHGGFSALTGDFMRPWAHLAVGDLCLLLVVCRSHASEGATYHWLAAGACLRLAVASMAGLQPVSAREWRPLN